MSQRGANCMQVITCPPDFEPTSNGYDCTYEPLGGAPSPTFPLPTPGLQGFVPRTVQWHEVFPPAGVVDRVFGNYELMSQALPTSSGTMITDDTGLLRGDRMLDGEVAP